MEIQLYAINICHVYRCSSVLIDRYFPQYSDRYDANYMPEHEKYLSVGQSFSEGWRQLEKIDYEMFPVSRESYCNLYSRDNKIIIADTTRAIKLEIKTKKIWK